MALCESGPMSKKKQERPFGAGQADGSDYAYWHKKWTLKMPAQAELQVTESWRWARFDYRHSIISNIRYFFYLDMKLSNK